MVFFIFAIVCSLRLMKLMDKYKPAQTPGHSAVEHTCWAPVLSEEWAVESLS